ncbi:MAG: flagellar hook assembly protein FlgD [Spirochaetes bacterium]|nr:flagellar hook assembly protein FlgD [Spirochaetota bacterium]
MDLSAITGSDLMDLTRRVEGINRNLQESRGVKRTLDKDDFLKLLVTQLSHQDPTQPMEDREFIAQMAQFTALEQITNLNKEFSSVARLIATSQAVGLLGRTVEIADGESLVRGTVREVLGGESPQLLVNNRYYDYSAVKRVME